jgi:pyruvate kinase
VHTTDIKDFSEMVQKATKIALHDGLAYVNERVVITAGVPFGTPGNTNVLRIHVIQDPEDPRQMSLVKGD